MMVSFILIFVWVLSGIFVKMKMPLSLSFLVFIFLMSLLSFKKSITEVSGCTLLSQTSSVSASMVTLSVWVVMLMILVSLKYQQDKKSSHLFNGVLSVLFFFIFIFFLTDNLIVMYILFESSLIPTLVLVMKWGYQPERLKSSFYFIMYTVCLSLPLLFMIMKMKGSSFSSSMFSLMPLLVFNTFKSVSFSYLGMTLAFLVKVPMWGIHLWLPKAHVEAPVSGSMILAGVLLKLGGYGLIQMTKLNFKFLSDVKIALFSINLWGAFIVGWLCLYSVDVKSLIAYSSVIHMNMMVLGVLSGSPLGVYGGVLMMIAHGISSPGMFILANFNYEVVKSRGLVLQKGLLSTQPKLGLFWFILVAANMAAPPSLNLAGEVFVYISLLKVGGIMWIFIIFITFLSGVYNLYLYSSQQGGSLKSILPGLNFISSSFLVMVLSSLPGFISFFLLCILV